jgi:hypothetical protein
MLSTAQVAQAGWQSLVKEAQGQAIKGQVIKGTAQVRATSRTVPEATADVSEASTKAVTNAQNWQSMVQAANKLFSSPVVKEEAKVTVKVGQQAAPTYLLRAYAVAARRRAH